ncbi:BID domain-containing T4SS effector [Bartonella taylorii]|uniref:BID domain-containing T4SS effector n=1 Tax=Bartonella taylorii TaxID=33046 RepID=UPI001ABB9734|nr:BID domain-containing T4SS effector [Bartonella taylorii]
MKEKKTSPSVKELIKYYEQVKTEIPQLEGRYVRVIPKNTKSVPILKKKEQRQALFRETASATKKNPTRPLTTDNMMEDRPQAKKTHVEIPSRKAKITLSEEQITKLVPYNSLVKGYKRDLYQHCQIVYGNERALQEKIKEIQQNPAIGKDLTWQIALNPDNFSKLAGRNICGVKNEQRKQAEESITHLCDAIDRFTGVVEYARECLTRFPNMELKRYGKLMSPRKMARILQTPDHSEREKGPLSNAEITARIQKYPEVQRHQAQIQYWSKTVFGNSSALQKQTECLLEDPSMGDILMQHLAVKPESFHKLAGVSMCGIKNKARRHAETGLVRMIEYVDRFADAVEQAREGILQNQHRQQDLSKAPERLSATMHHEVPETSRQAQERAQSVRPRKTLGTKALALVS